MRMYEDIHEDIYEDIYKDIYEDMTMRTYMWTNADVFGCTVNQTFERTNQGYGNTLLSFF